MAEIKSTLDLVMERTRNLTMSEEDRREQAAAEFRAGVNRILQRYLEAGLDAGRFQEDLRRLEKDFPESGAKAAVAEIAKRIDPALDNRPLLVLLREGCEKDVSRIEGLLKKYIETADLMATSASERILERLRKEGISGSAVVPNTAADNELAGMREEMLEQFRTALAAEIDRLG
ncbi:MAG: hypothetical protein WAW37_09125 [Syntrophobacteraceae bacterium]